MPRTTVLGGEIDNGPSVRSSSAFHAVIARSGLAEPIIPLQGERLERTRDHKAPVDKWPQATKEDEKAVWVEAVNGETGTCGSDVLQGLRQRVPLGTCLSTMTDEDIKRALERRDA